MGKDLETTFPLSCLQKTAKTFIIFIRHLPTQVRVWLVPVEGRGGRGGSVLLQRNMITAIFMMQYQ